MKTQFNKIVLVSLSDGFSKEIGEKLSQSLGMLFCDTKDMIEYELIDRDSLKEISSKKYLEDSERKVIKHIASFENVVVAINYDYFVHNLNILKNGSLFVFLKLPEAYVKKTQPVMALNFSSRCQGLEKDCNLTVEISKTEADFVVKKIIDKIGEIL